MNEYNKEQSIRRGIYYWQGYPYDDGRDIITIEDQGGGIATDKEVKEAIQAALDSIYLQRVDDDTLQLVVGDRTINPDGGGSGDGKTDFIDDVYLTAVETIKDDDGNNVGVRFVRNNDKESIEVNIDDLDSSIIDCQTF